MSLAAVSPAESEPSGEPRIRRVLIIGAGTMGAEVAAQCVAHGYEVSLFDIDPQQLEVARQRLQAMMAEQARLGNITVEQGAAAQAKLQFTSDPQIAAAGVDLVTESVTENLKIKREVFAQFSALCPATTIFTTNTSYFVPSMMARSVARPEQFAAFHFHVPVSVANVVDIMPHPGTSPQTIERLRQFALSIGQTPIVSRVENHGYVFNAMLREFLSTAVSLAARGVADVQDIDRSWMGVTKMPIGPFGMIDTIGLDTVHDIVSFWGAAAKDQQARANATWLKERIDEGRHGMRTGRGFYEYPDPAFSQTGFLQSPIGLPRQVETAAEQSSPVVVPEVTVPEVSVADSPAVSELVSPAASPALTKTVEQTVAQTAIQRAASSTGIQRWTITFQHAEPLPTGRLNLLGPVLIVGHGPAADALEQLVQQQGVVFRPPALNCPAQAAAWATDLFALHDVPHLVLLTGLEGASVTMLTAEATARRANEGLLIPYMICQGWYRQRLERGILDQSMLLAGVMLGGSFGLEPPVVAAEGGGMAGLMKATYLEGIASGVAGFGKEGVFGPQTRLVDLSGNQAPRVVADLLAREFQNLIDQAREPIADPAEVFRRYAEKEVGYRGARRQRLRVRRAPLQQSTQEQHTGPARGEVWVATGGARGITARITAALGKQFGVKLHLLGTTACPEENLAALDPAALEIRKQQIMKAAYSQGEKPNVAWERVARGLEIQRTLAELHQAGVAATYHVCDVSNHAALEQVLANVRAQDGPIHGILHGAGVEITRRFDHKPLEEVELTLRPKFAGTLALMELTQQDPLRWFVAFGSLAGRFGGVGQTDYAVANEVLAKLVDWFRGRRPDCRAWTIHWPGWEETGMAARPASRFSLSRVGHTMLPPAEGVRLFLQELTAGGPDAEVVYISEAEIPEPLRLES